MASLSSHDLGISHGRNPSANGRPAAPVDAESPVCHRVVLDSGLRVLAVGVPHASRMVITAQLQTGSRFETLRNNGISHFLEHMLFRGTPSAPTAHEQALSFESLGGTLVASTAADVGELAIAVPPESFEAVMPRFAEAYMYPRFHDIDVERGIVAEEIRESLDEKGEDIDADNRIRALAFADHPLGLPITGTLRDLRGFTRARLRARHLSHYTASSTVLTVVGPLDPERALRQVTREFRSLAAGTRPSCRPPPAQRAARFHFIPHASSQTAIKVAFRAPGYHHPDEPALELLVRILDDGMAARLYSTLCDAQGLCYDVTASYEAYADSGMLELGAECTHSHALRVLEQLFGIVDQLKRQGPSVEEIERAKRRHAWQLRDVVQDAAELAGFLANAELTDRPLQVQARRQQLELVSRDDLLLAMGRWLVAAHLSVVVVGSQSRVAQSKLRAEVAGFAGT